MANRIRVTKQFDFHMAHALEGYDGLCRHIHGHEYKLLVTIMGEQSSKDGMVLDFKVLKKLVQDNVLDYYDHSLLLKKTDKSEKIHDDLLKGWGNVHIVDYQPTSENILMDIVGRLTSSIPSNLQLLSVRLYETSSSYAEWNLYDN